MRISHLIARQDIYSSHACRFVATLMLATLLSLANVFAQAPAAYASAAQPPSAEELDKLVAPIALYPDDLVALVLPASTNPLQIVMADRFLEKRKSAPNLPVDESWDDAVKSLLNYPEIIKTMSNDLDWTASLGEAVVADQAAVLAAVQAFRRKTQAAGNLKSDDKQTVVVEKEVVKIVPADPQVIYVPQYNPSTVVVAGASAPYGYYSSPYPVYYYPYAPGAAFATGLVWGAALGAAWNGGHYTTHYGGGTANINIDRSVNVGSVNRANVSTSRAQVSQWKSNKQPGQVRSTAGRPQSTRVGYGTSASGTRYGASGSAATQSSSRVSGSGTSRQTAGEARTSRSSSASTGVNRSGMSSNVSRSNTGTSSVSRTGTSGGAFSGSSSGYQARLDSSRGAASRSSMSGRSAGGYSSPRGGAGGGRGGGRR